MKANSTHDINVCSVSFVCLNCPTQLNKSESMEQQMGFLNKQFLLLGEANKLCMEEIERLGPEASKVGNGP